MPKSSYHIRKVLCMQFGGVKFGPVLKTTVNFLRYIPISRPTKIKQNIQMHRMKDAEMF